MSNSQLLEYGFVVGFNSFDPSICIITDGFFTIEAYIGKGRKVQMGRAYMVTKLSSSYHVGAEVNMQ